LNACLYKICSKIVSCLKNNCSLSDLSLWNFHFIYKSMSEKCDYFWTQYLQKLLKKNIISYSLYHLSFLSIRCSNKFSFRTSSLYEQVQFSNKCSFRTSLVFEQVLCINKHSFRTSSVFEQVQFSNMFNFRTKSVFEQVLFSNKFNFQIYFFFSPSLFEKYKLRFVSPNCFSFIDAITTNSFA
jgi:hypothetical protein